MNSWVSQVSSTLLAKRTPTEKIFPINEERSSIFPDSIFSMPAPNLTDLQDLGPNSFSLYRPTASLPLQRSRVQQPPYLRSPQASLHVREHVQPENSHMMYDAGALNRDWINPNFTETGQTRIRAGSGSNGTRQTVELNSLTHGRSLVTNNRPIPITAGNPSNQRSTYDQYPTEPSYGRQRYDYSTAPNFPKSRRPNSDSKGGPKASSSEGASTKYISQWGTMVNMIRNIDISYHDFQRSYSEKLNAAIARYPEQSKDWQLWYAEGVLWEANFSGKKFPGKEPFKLPILPSPPSAQSEHYVTIESLMEAKALKGGFRRQFFQSLNAKRHEANEKRPTIERYKKAFWVDNEIWAQFWPNEPFPVKEPSWADCTADSGGTRRPQQKTDPPVRPCRTNDTPLGNPLQIEPLKTEPDSSIASLRNSAESSNPPINTRFLPSTRNSPGPTTFSNPTTQPPSMIQGRAPAHILQGLLETQKNWQCRPPATGKIIMINRIPVVCNDNPNLPREIFLSLQAEDDHRGWEVQLGIGCHIQCTSVSTGDLLLWTTPLANGNSITEMPGIHFIQGWIQRILTHGLVTISSHWRDLQNQSNTQPLLQEVSSETPEETMREEYKTTFRASDLDMMVIEETAKVEGNLRLVVDEETGEVITVAELVKRTRERCALGLMPLGIKRKDDRRYENVNKKICS
ncbi:hypothetical protein K3495_g9492 [Podosphaera aphanis]|nr:hypothetical protein K3495_g9492 [Podosphaera aphanis]